MFDRQQAVVNDLWQRARELLRTQGKSPESVKAASAWWAASKALKARRQQEAGE